MKRSWPLASSATGGLTLVACVCVGAVLGAGRARHPGPATLVPLPNAPVARRPPEPLPDFSGRVTLEPIRAGVWRGHLDAVTPGSVGAVSCTKSAPLVVGERLGSEVVIGCDGGRLARMDPSTGRILTGGTPIAPAGR
jgi:hypothetical protein